MAGKKSSAGSTRILLCALLCLLVLGGALNGSCVSYAQPCSAQDDCCEGLSCIGGKCNQAGKCTIMPEAIEPSPPQMPANGSQIGPMASIESLQNGSGIGNGGLDSGSGLYRAGWFNNWQTSGFIGIVIAISIISLVAMAGHGFNLPAAKAFVDTELAQTFVSALIIIGAVAFIGFLDVFSHSLVAASDLPVQCGTAEPCYLTAAKSYLKLLMGVSSDYSKGQLEEAIDLQRRSSYGGSLNAHVWWLAFAGVSMRPNAGFTLGAERAGSLFDTGGRIMGSLEAQHYFMDVIAYGIAPVFLFLGILLRTFFFTRKLGGLLLSIALALFIVYPLTYAFAWYTLNVAVYGDRLVQPSDPSCPAECKSTYPVAFFIDKNDGAIRSFETTQDLMTAGIRNENWESGDVDGDGEPEYPGLVACRNLSNANLSESVAINQCGNCPDYCRDVPFPSSMPGCDISDCATCNPGCKIMRQRSDCSDPSVCDPVSCSIAECRTRLPVENKCYFKDEHLGSLDVSPANLSVSCSGCEGCPHWCKMVRTKPNGTVEHAYSGEPGCAQAACYPPFMTVPGTGMAGTCPLACLYDTPVMENTECDTACDGCPRYCRIDGLGSYSEYDTTDPSIIANCSSYSEACGNCPSSCKIALADPPEGTGCADYPVTNYVSANCVDCPVFCRWQDFDFMFAGTGRFGNYSAAAINNSSFSIPINCQTDDSGRPVCGGSACGSACNVQETGELPFCRVFSDTGSDDTMCRKCPENARIMLEHTDASGATTQFLPSLPTQYKCGNEKCPHESCFYDQAAAFPIPAQPHETERSCTKSENERCDMNAESENCCTPGLECARTNTGITDIVSRQLDGYRKEASEPRVLFRTDIDSEVVTTIISCKACGTTLGFGDACTPANAGCCPLGGECINGRCFPYCKDYDPAFSGTPHKCELCPESCRVNGAVSAYLSSSECAMCGEENCPLECKAELDGVQGTVCSEYIGNMPPRCVGASNHCHTYTNQSACVDSTYDCEWNPRQCFGPGACNTKETIGECEMDSACTWTNEGSIEVPIDYRNAPYNQRNGCAQCPEYCRIDEYEGDCGAGGNQGERVDCSQNSCPSACRLPIRLDSPPGLCQDYDANELCTGCPAFCRRIDSADSPGLDPNGPCPADSCAYYGQASMCPVECRLPDSPERMCSGCMDCPADCLYYPAIRTDCAEVCSDETLQGPVSIAPSDFIKKLPGAEGKPDVKGAGILLVPALIMPLFCIVMTISFIRIFSQMLGGDIEIPGIGRII